MCYKVLKINECNKYFMRENFWEQQKYDSNLILIVLAVNVFMVMMLLLFQLCIFYKVNTFVKYTWESASARKCSTHLHIYIKPFYCSTALFIIPSSLKSNKFVLSLQQVFVTVPSSMPQTMPAQRRGKGICGCFGSNEPPEITYHVVENGGIINLQPHPLTPTQPMPDEEELNSKFAELVVSTKSSCLLSNCPKNLLI